MDLGLCDDLHGVIFQFLDFSSLFSLLLVSTRLQAKVNHHWITHPPESGLTVVTDAIRQGYLGLLQWQDAVKPIRCQLRHMMMAASGGHLSVVQWLHSQRGCPWETRMCDCADHESARRARIYTHGGGCYYDAGVCDVAAKHGHLLVLQYLHDHYCPWNEKTCAHAAGGGHLAVLQYLHTNQCPWDETACWSAAKHGHLEILKYLHVSGCPWDQTVSAQAAINGQLEVLKYLHLSGCPWHVDICAAVAQHGHLEVLKYLSIVGVHVTVPSAWRLIMVSLKLFNLCTNVGILGTQTLVLVLLPAAISMSSSTFTSMAAPGVMQRTYILSRTAI